jgi:PhzF family phenazine biosynthesis protein
MQDRQFRLPPALPYLDEDMERVRAMKLRLWQIDAFARKPFEGNPAAVVPLGKWLPDDTMRRIADENNLSETAFFVEIAPGKYDLRWFTPRIEADLCGHATLASAFLIFETLAPDLNVVSFRTRSGELTVKRAKEGLAMTLPSNPIAPFPAAPDFAGDLGAALDAAPPAELYMSRYLIAVWKKAEDIRTMTGPGAIQPLLAKAASWGLIVTAPGTGDCDFVSRVFAPAKGVPEDPVTGSAHAALTPFWAKRLGRKTLRARQVSPRGGDIACIYEGAHTTLIAPCAFYMTGEITV